MEDKEIVQQIEQGVKESENWSVYHHLKDKLGYPALMLRQTNTSANSFGVNIDIFKGYAYLFLDMVHLQNLASLSQCKRCQIG